MARYSVEIVRSVEKQLDQLVGFIHGRVVEKLLSLENEPRPFGVQKLQGTNYYRVRIGDYRVIYEINDATKVVRVLDVGHRRDVYRKY